MNTLTVVATFEAKPGKEAELRAALTDLLAPTRQEAGCLNYDLHQATEHPAKFLFHENWTSKAHLDTHLQSAHVQAVLARLDELCVAPPEISLWERIG
ncbi:MAG: antibiotic biosynthesis monooxygenase [Verrucomicrobiae bacterium]|nr:antibiotic biosynthesis monooxygenase [Verrucomicrobiae bacterium]